MIKRFIIGVFVGLVIGLLAGYFLFSSDSQQIEKKELNLVNKEKNEREYKLKILSRRLDYE